MPSEPNFDSPIPTDPRELHALLELVAESTDEGLRDLTERLFTSCADQLDAALTPHLLELGEAFLRSDQQLEFYASPDHPLRQLLDLLITRGRTWYARDSKISLQFFEQFVALMEAGKDYFATKNNAALTTRMNNFCEWLDAEEKRAAKVEARLCEAEINHLKNLTAECKVIDFINKPLAQNLFPAALIDGIGILKSELLHSLFTTGDDSLLWKSWQRLLPLLGEVFANNTDEQFVYRSVPVMLNELERSQSMGISNADFYRQWIGELSDCLTLIVKKQAVACLPFAPLPYPEGHSHLNARVTDAVLKHGNSIPQGAWMQFSGENEQLVRCKLALKNADIDQLLFVDHTGRKVMIKSTKDFSLCLSTGIAKLLDTTHLQDILQLLLQNLSETAALRQAQLEADEAAQKLRMQTVAELQKKLAQQKVARAKAEQQRQVAAENAARRAAAQKALAEARTLAEEKARRAAEQAVAEERERQRMQEAETAENLQRFQLANIQVSSLNLGARVEFLQNGQWVKCKLAVIIAANGKYIFSDNLGRKIAELQREQLVQALINKELNLLNNGDSFDDQLAKVIRGLRKDIS